jgi:hypothetical protein
MIKSGYGKNASAGALKTPKNTGKNAPAARFALDSGRFRLSLDVASPKTPGKAGGKHQPPWQTGSSDARRNAAKNSLNGV